MIYSNVDFVDFENAFRRHGRMDDFPNTLHALFDHLNEVSQELIEFDMKGNCVGLELDVIAICCDYSEYDMDELKEAYSHLLDSELDPESEQYSDEFIEALSCELYMLIDCDNGYFLVNE